MKKSFKIFGCTMALAAITAFPAFAEMPAQYSELIKSIQDDFANGLPAYNQNTDDSQMSMYYDNSHYRTGDLSGYAYALMDLDGNGVDELLFVEASDYSIDDIWTVENSNLVHVAHGFVRSTYYLTADGQIVNEWSSGAYDNGVDYYKLQGSKLVKVRSENYPTYSVKTISYTTFNGKPYYINIASDYSKIHIGVKADAYVNSNANYKEYDDCYEIPVSVIYYEFPLVDVDEYDDYAGTYTNSNLRFTKDAKISYINWDTYERDSMSIKEYLEKNNGNFPNCIDVNSYNASGYITDAYWYWAG